MSSQTLALLLFLRLLSFFPAGSAAAIRDSSLQAEAQWQNSTSRISGPTAPGVGNATSGFASDITSSVSIGAPAQTSTVPGSTTSSLGLAQFIEQGLGATSTSSSSSSLQTTSSKIIASSVLRPSSRQHSPILATGNTSLANASSGSAVKLSTVSAQNATATIPGWMFSQCPELSAGLFTPVPISAAAGSFESALSCDNQYRDYWSSMSRLTAAIENGTSVLTYNKTTTTSYILAQTNAVYTLCDGASRLNATNFIPGYTAYPPITTVTTQTFPYYTKANCQFSNTSIVPAILPNCSVDNKNCAKIWDKFWSNGAHSSSRPFCQDGVDEICYQWFGDLLSTNTAFCGTHGPSSFSGTCTIVGNSVQIYYWPPSTTQALCDTAIPTAAPSISAQLNGTRYTTYIHKNSTMTFFSPTVYISLDVVSAIQDVPAAPGHWVGDQFVGSFYTDVILGIPPVSMSSMVGHLEGFSGSWQDELQAIASQQYPNLTLTPRPYNWGHMSPPFPASDYFFGKGDNYQFLKSLWSSAEGYIPNGQYWDTIYLDYMPKMSVPLQLRDLDPLWGGCLPYLGGIYDPPKSLQPVGTAAMPTLSAPVQTTTPPSPSATAQPIPSATSTNAPATTEVASSKVGNSHSASSSLATSNNPQDSQSETSDRQTSTASQNPGGVLISLLDPSNTESPLPSIVTPSQVGSNPSSTHVMSSSTEDNSDPDQPVPTTQAQGGGEGSQGSTRSDASAQDPNTASASDPSDSAAQSGTSQSVEASSVGASSDPTAPQPAPVATPTQSQQDNDQSGLTAPNTSSQGVATGVEPTAAQSQHVGEPTAAGNPDTSAQGQTANIGSTGAASQNQGPVPVATVGTQTIIADPTDPGNGVIIGSSTALQPGQTTQINGVPVSVGSSEIVVGGSTAALPTASAPGEGSDPDTGDGSFSGSTVTVGNSATLASGFTSINSAGQTITGFDLGSTVVISGGSAVVVGSNTASIDSSGHLVIGGSTISNVAEPAPTAQTGNILTIGSTTVAASKVITTDPAGHSVTQVVIGGSTFAPGAVATVGIDNLSVDNSGNVVIGGSTVFGGDPQLAVTSSNAGAFTIGSSVLTASQVLTTNNAGNVITQAVIDGTTLLPGDILFVGTATVSLDSFGHVILDESTVPVASLQQPTSAHGVVLTFGTSTLTASEVVSTDNAGHAATLLVIGENTLQLDESLTVGSDTLSMDPSGNIIADGSIAVLSDLVQAVPQATGAYLTFRSSLVTVSEALTTDSAGHTITQAIVDGTTIQTGGLLTFGTDVVSVGSDGIVVDGTTAKFSALPEISATAGVIPISESSESAANVAVVTIGPSQTLTATKTTITGSDGQTTVAAVVGSQTLTAGGPAITSGGEVISVQSDGDLVVSDAFTTKTAYFSTTTSGTSASSSVGSAPTAAQTPSSADKLRIFSSGLLGCVELLLATVWIFM